MRKLMASSGSGREQSLFQDESNKYLGKRVMTHCFMCWIVLECFGDVVLTPTQCSAVRLPQRVAWSEHRDGMVPWKTEHPVRTEGGIHRLIHKT